MNQALSKIEDSKLVAGGSAGGEPRRPSITAFDSPRGHFDVQWFTGTVADHGAMATTHVSSSGGGGYLQNGTGYVAPARVTSTTVIHDSIFLVDQSGRERSFQLQNFNVACRTGNEMTIVWVIRSGEKDGPYLAVRNHTTGEPYIATKATFGRVFADGSWKLVVPAIWVAAVILAVLIGPSMLFVGAGATWWYFKRLQRAFDERCRDFLARLFA
jgi:hypothetical protein